MTKKRAWHKALGSAIVATLAVSACGGGSDNAVTAESVATEALSAKELTTKANKEGTVVWYTNSPTTATRAVADAFMKKYPKIKVKVQRLVTFQLWQRFRAEAASGKNNADVFTQSNWGITDSARQQDLITKYVPDVAKKEFDANYYDPEGYHFTGRVVVSALAYNTKELPGDSRPKTWDDLLDPSWKGRLGLLDPEENAYGFEHLWQMANSKEIGKGYFKKLAKNDPKLYAESGQLVNALASGEISAAASLSYRTRIYREKGAPLALAFPEVGVGNTLNYNSMVTKAPHPYAARLFLDYLATQDAQATRQKVLHGYATNPAIEPRMKDKQPLTDIRLLERRPEKMFANFDPFNKWFADTMN